MSSKQHRNLQAAPADAEALESLQHMTSWARDSITSPAATRTSYNSLVDSFAIGATAFHPGPWVLPTEGIIEIAEEQRPSAPSVGIRAARAIGGAAKRLWGAFQRHREHARAAAVLSQLDDRSLQDIGISRADIQRATRHGRDWDRWR